MLFFVLSIINATAFPICIAPGDQLVPQVLWDSEQFLVVWSDGRNQNTGIYATGIQESGVTEEPFRLYSIEGVSIAYPKISYCTDSIFLSFWIDDLDFVYGLLGFVLLNDSGISYWETHDNIYEGNGPIEPVRCKNHFALLYTYGCDYEYEYPTWSTIALLDDGKLKPILNIPSIPGINPPTSGVGHGVWNGERLLCSTSAGFIWLEDTLTTDQLQNFFYPRDTTYYWNELAMAAMDERIGMIGHCGINGNNYYFDLLDAEGTPINENPVFLKFTGLSSWFRPTSMAFGNGRFITVSEAAIGGFSGERTLWGAEIDSNVTLHGEGFMMAGPAQEKDPDICFGQNHFLLVWSDNRNGNWDIYGMILDSLEYAGVEEDVPTRSEVELTVSKTVFTDEVRISLVRPAARQERIVVRDVLGRTVRELGIGVGENSVYWDGRDMDGVPLTNGVYFVSLAGDVQSVGIKLIKLCR